MLKVLSVSKSFGPDQVLKDVTFTLSPAVRAGLIGPNGSGKTTLLRLISGQDEPDRGSVWIDPADSVAYLPQYPDDELQLSVRDALLRDTGISELERRVGSLERAMADASGARLDALMSEYAQVGEELERRGGYAIEARLEQVIAGLSLDARPDVSVAFLSGGNKTKLSLGRLLMSHATILLLDEPTNYLDLRALLWLERFIADSDKTFLIVSHDRRFLDRTVDTILEINPREHTVRSWSGNYSAYAEARRQEEEKHLAMYLDQQAEVRRIEADIRRTKEQARSVEHRTKGGMGADQQRRYAKKVAKKAKVRERRLERELTGGNAIEKPRQTWGLHVADLSRTQIDDNRIVVEARDVRAGYDGQEVLAGVHLSIRGRDRVALLGGNGSGKSTLARCIAGTLPCDGELKIGTSVRVGYLAQEQHALQTDRSAVDIVRAAAAMSEADARTYLHKFLFSGDEALKRVGSLSYGQRAKLALATMIVSEANFLVLDEPTSHMDLPALEAIERALATHRGPLLVISHDRHFLDGIGVNRVLVLEAGRLRESGSVEAYGAELLDPR